jgi:hypothetical protein
VIVINESPTEFIYESDEAPLSIAEAPEPGVQVPQAPLAEQVARPTSLAPEAGTSERRDDEVVEPPAYPPWANAGLSAGPSLHEMPFQRYPYARGPGLLRVNTAEPGASWLLELEPSVGQQDGVRAGLFDVRWLLENRFEVPGGVVALWEQDAWAVLSRWGVGYRFYQGPHLFARMEIGGRLWLDDVQTAVGCYAGFGLTAYVAKPLTLDFDTNVGVVGNARVLEGTAFIGIGWDRAALRAGYRALYVDEVSLSSPMIGVAGWL